MPIEMLSRFFHAGEGGTVTAAAPNALVETLPVADTPMSPTVLRARADSLPAESAAVDRAETSPSASDDHTSGRDVGEALSIHLTGALDVRRGDESLPLPASRKTRALLAYLVLTARPHRRERLCELFWDIPDDPRGALRWSLSKLRRVVDEPGRVRIAADRERVAFVTLDVELDVEGDARRASRTPRRSGTRPRCAPRARREARATAARRTRAASSGAVSTLARWGASGAGGAARESERASSERASAIARGRLSPTARCRWRCTGSGVVSPCGDRERQAVHSDRDAAAPAPGESTAALLPRGRRHAHRPRLHRRGATARRRTGVARPSRIGAKRAARRAAGGGAGSRPHPRPPRRARQRALRSRCRRLLARGASR